MTCAPVVIRRRAASGFAGMVADEAPGMSLGDAPAKMLDMAPVNAPH